MVKKWIIKHRKVLLGLIIVFSVAYYFSLGNTLFTDPYSTVLEARGGELLCASIASDGQWRFPQGDSVPKKFIEALTTFEDKRFFSHPGVDILSLGRAFRQNSKARKIVSGGSTISMQVIRLSRKGKSRTFFEKSLELILATRLELRYTKEEILALYSSHAPFGGNVVGLEAACWRYFGTSSQELSWAQASLLAVLPNSPSLIHPGKNRVHLKIKRDNLLDKLKSTGKIDELTCSLSKAEEIPEHPHPLPRMARHLLIRMANDGHAQKILTSTIDHHSQHRIEQILNDHHNRLKANQIFNGAAIVVDVTSGRVLAYAGNVSSPDSHENEVDVIVSPRSTGSILKPFLYAAMIEEGKILPKTLLPDVPVLINGFAPQNFSHEYDGAVPADKALIRSLNVPAVHMLKDYRYEKFHTLLRNVGMTTLRHSPDHYGLSLILGGAEGTLWDITGMYASMARTLNNYFEHPGKNRYYKTDFHQPFYYSMDSGKSNENLEESSWLSAGSIFLTFETLKEVFRPGEETGWRYFNNSKNIAWKTGTSFGFRDGWAVGVTPEFAVGVWIGNADGEGRPGLTGSDTAAPLMFDIFSQLPGNSWFNKPYPELIQLAMCKKTGYRMSAFCQEPDTVWVTKSATSVRPCPYHKIIHLTKDKKYQVHSACADVSDIQHVSWFVLPPVQEYYYKPKNISYKVLPPHRKNCVVASSVLSMDMVYPKHNARIFIPRDLDGSPGNAVFELAHRSPAVTVYWHLNDHYIGSTKKIHRLALSPSEGKHKLTLMDDHGEILDRTFEVISGARN
jgi:penicillin-binding protein 1C